METFKNYLGLSLTILAIFIVYDGVTENDNCHIYAKYRARRFRCRLRGEPMETFEEYWSTHKYNALDVCYSEKYYIFFGVDPDLTKLFKSNKKDLNITETGINIKNETPDVTDSASCLSPLECFISFNFNLLVLTLVLMVIMLLLFFIYQIFIKNLLRFDIVSNYYVIQIFSSFFSACYTLIAIVLNDRKSANLFKLEEIKSNIFYSFSDILNLVPKLKKFFNKFYFLLYYNILCLFFFTCRHIFLRTIFIKFYIGFVNF